MKQSTLDRSNDADAPFTIPLQALRPGDYYQRQTTDTTVTQLLSVSDTQGNRGGRRKPQFFEIAIHAFNDDASPKVTAFVRSQPMSVIPVNASEAGDKIRNAVQAKRR